MLKAAKDMQVIDMCSLYIFGVLVQIQVSEIIPCLIMSFGHLNIPTYLAQTHYLSWFVADFRPWFNRALMYRLKGIDLRKHSSLCLILGKHSTLKSMGLMISPDLGSKCLLNQCIDRNILEKIISMSNQNYSLYFHGKLPIDNTLFCSRNPFYSSY